MKRLTYLVSSSLISLMMVACGGGSDQAVVTTPGSAVNPVATSGFVVVPRPSGGDFGLDCVKDLSTGLMWEGKSSEPSSLNYWGRRLTHYTSFAELEKRGDKPGVYVTPTLGEIITETNVHRITYETNLSARCGFNDWRVPTRLELLTLVRPYVVGTASIDARWFPLTDIGNYWTVDPGAHAGEAVVVNFANGAAGVNDRTVPAALRLVRTSP